MASRVVGRQRGFRQGPRRQTSWETGPGDNTLVTQITSAGSSFVGSAITPTIPGLTIVRLRGGAQFFLSASDSALGGFGGAFGIGIATLAAVTAGAASVPTPLTEQDWNGWIYWTPITVRQITATTADGANSSGIYMRLEVDTKAMRKMKEEDAMYAMIQVSNETGVSVLQASFDSRVLAMLP